MFAISKYCECVTEVIQKSGRLDIVINNAGVGITGPIEEIPTEEIWKQFWRPIYLVQ